MTINTLRNQLAQESGVTNTVRLDWALKYALLSVEDLAAFPSEVIEFSVTDSLVDMVLPYKVGTVLGIKNSASCLVELTSMSERFQAYSSIPELVQATDVGTTCFDTEPTLSGVLKFRSSGSSTTQVDITVFGETTTADQYEETIRLIPGVVAQTAAAFTKNVSTLSKSTVTPYNVEILQADDTLVSTLPGGYLDAPRKILRFPYAADFLIHYKPALPDALPGGMTVTPGYDRAVLMEALHHLNLDKISESDPTVFRNMAKPLFNTATSKNERGKVTTIDWGRGYSSRQGYV